MFFTTYILALTLWVYKRVQTNRPINKTQFEIWCYSVISVLRPLQKKVTGQVFMTCNNLKYTKRMNFLGGVQPATDQRLTHRWFVKVTHAIPLSIPYSNRLGCCGSCKHFIAQLCSNSSSSSGENLLYLPSIHLSHEVQFYILQINHLSRLFPPYLDTHI